MGTRLFVAVDVDEATRDQIGRIASNLRERLGTIDASWVRPERMHLTLSSFGDASPDVERRLENALAEAVDEAPFEITFRGIGVFPNPRRPRVLWLGVDAGGEALCRLQRVVAQKIDPDSGEERFTPHLTLARFRGRVAAGGLAARWATLEASAGPSLIDRVTLYESRLAPAGPTYLRRAEALLKPWTSAPPSS